MPIERCFFDPERLAMQLRINTAQALRMIADALDDGQMDVQLVGCIPHGMSRNWRDQRAHLMVKLDLAAQIHLPVQVPDRLEHGERKELP